MDTRPFSPIFRMGLGTRLLLCMSWTPDIELSDPIHLADMFTLLQGTEYLHNTPLVILSSSMWKRSMQCQWLYRAPFLIYFFSDHPSWSQIISCLKNSIFLNCQKLKPHDPVWSSGTHILFPWSLYMNNQQTTSLIKIGLGFPPIPGLISCAGVTGDGNGDCYLMHRMQSDAWCYSKVRYKYANWVWVWDSALKYGSTGVSDSPFILLYVVVSDSAMHASILYCSAELLSSWME